MDAISPLTCLDMDAWELVEKVRDAISAISQTKGYKFHKNDVFHIRRDGVTTVDASGAFFAHYFNLAPDVAIDKLSDYQEHIPMTRFLLDLESLERLTTAVLGISEANAEIVFMFLTLFRFRERVESMDRFERPSFKTFEVPNPKEDLQVYLDFLTEFGEYVKENALFKDWEGRK